MNANTILITGASSGIGKATATFFQEKGWNVVATMRRPEEERELNLLDHVLVTRLDVTDEHSIQAAVDAAVETFGQIDVLLNNAGYGAYGPLEAFPLEAVRRQFETNVIGLLAVTRAVLPHMRARKSGTIVNMSSVGGRITLPLRSLYHGTKHAIEGISEALVYELEPIGVKVKILEPGAVETEFGSAVDFRNDESMTEYQDMVESVMKSSPDVFTVWSSASLVAEAVWEAVADGTDRLRYVAGVDADEYINLRATLDDAAYVGTIRERFQL